ncbi:MAG TPA: HlyD family type I secretion periplasmic adaptor subunit [Gammaproteobacteria bacterium]|nr:HlyD family type I secretion periplasmic adaptor subunit [Gammaproteobacteria bacterium]
MTSKTGKAVSPVPDDNLVTSMEGPKRIGMTLIFLVFVVFGGWAVIAPLNGAAFAPGTVTVKSYKKVVQHLEGGIVADILTRDGDLVEQGQPLLILDDTQSTASLEIANTQYTALRAKEARLIAERDGLERVTYPGGFSTQNARAQREVNAQNEIFAARKAANEGREEILGRRVDQLQNQVVGMRALRSSKQQLATSYEDELRDTQALLAQGFSEKTRLRQAERNFASFSGEAAELTANIAATEVRIGEARLQILQQDSDFQNEVVTELGEVQTTLQDVRERVTALEDLVHRTTVVAPDTGVVNGMQIHTIGGVIGPGSPIAEIVPESDELIIEASVNTIDIDRVSEGQEARIRFSTFGSSAPTIFGQVISLSADARQNDATGIPFYLARVEVYPDGMEELGDLALMPGMPAEVFINTGARTFIQYLFKPLSNAVARSFNED